MNIYELKNVKKYRGTSLTLDIGSLSLRQRAFYIFHGPNGAGKTTLLNLLAFLDSPSEGKIKFLDTRAGPGRPYDSRPAREVTLVMQNPYLFKTSVIKNITSGLVYRALCRKEITRRVEPVMKKLGLWEIRQHNVASLSGGEMRKVALARALVLDTKALLLDEPTAHLDKAHAGIIEEVVTEIARSTERTVIMTTHDLAQAHRLTENVVFLLDGRIMGTPLWNLFRVELMGKEGMKSATLGERVKIFAATDRTGAASIAVNPTDIIVSKERNRSSALNSLEAQIIGISEMNGLIDVVADTGVSLHSFITRRSLDEMKLAVGQKVYFSFKASAVEVF